MTLRIVFTREDLQRIRISDEPDPMWELVQSLHQLQERRPAPRFSAWHQQARARIAGHDGARAMLGPLCTLVPPEGAFPDFLTPAPSLRDIEAGCERVVRTSPEFLLPDVAAAFSGRQAPLWIRDLATGDRSTLTDVAGALRGTYDLLLRPHWPDIRASIAADRAARLRTMSADGVRGLLSGLPGVLGWDGEVLEVRYPADRTLNLSGRGLTLIPSHFCWTNPISLMNPELPPVLVYSAGTDAAVKNADARGLAALLGPNRAACLTTLAKPHSTSALATRVGISVGSASKQATTLREAGLVVSERNRSAVVHRISPLGAALLAGKLPEY
jgi:DNA-binding transcriptional ArsR family regulator